MVLQSLSRRAHPAMRSHGITSNQSFAGVLFTGRMAGAPARGMVHLRSSSNDGFCTPPLLWPIGAPRHRSGPGGFAVSQPFTASPWRQKEWQALQALCAANEVVGA